MKKNALVERQRERDREKYLNGVQDGIALMGADCIIAMHNVMLGEYLTKPKFAKAVKELEIEMQRILDEHLENSKESPADASAILQRAVDEIRDDLGMEAIEWGEEMNL